MMSSFEYNLKECIESLHEQYCDDFRAKTSSFISLGIGNQYDLSLHDENNSNDISIEELFEEIKNNKKNVVLLGESGAGKSTLLLKLAIHLSDSNYNDGTLIPFLIECGSENEDDIKRLVHLEDFFSEKEMEVLWKQGYLFLMFDGINEVSGIKVKEYMNKIKTLSTKKHRKCKYIVSCRTLEYPIGEYYPFEKYYISPVTKEQIKEKFVKELGEQRGQQYYSELCHGPQNYLLDICRTPLLLTMITNILSNPGNETSLGELKNKSDIYKKFYQGLRIWEEKKPFASEDNLLELRDELFQQLSYYMQAKGIVYICKEDLVYFIRNAKYQNILSCDTIEDLKNKEGRRWYSKVIEDLKRCGFFKVYQKIDESSFSIAFIHQSFQEYFAGCFLCDSNRILESKYTTFLLQNGNIDEPITIEKEQKRINENSKKNWAAIEFASNQDAERKIIDYTMRYAQKRKDSNGLELAAKCVLQDAKDDKSKVDDCCIWLLEAFKFWSIPYKYNLIYAANRLLSYVSEDFPDRLKRDIIYYGKKYTGGYIEIEYPETFDIDYLKRIISEDSIEHRLNAIFTIGERKWLQEDVGLILDYLFSLLEEENNTIREATVKAIKRVIENNKGVEISDEKIKLLIDLIKNPQESAEIRAFTLNTVAQIGDDRAFPVCIEYLKNHDNPYRDSASWSLQRLIEDSENPNYSKEKMNAFYFECLMRESNDETGMYSKGNLVYTLSRFSATSYIEGLKNWIVNESEPFVQEDGISAIGELSDIEGYSFLERYSHSSDPVIRSKALRSMLRLDKDRFWSEKKDIVENDPFSIVSEIADEETFFVRESIESIMSIDESNNTVNEHVEQSYENVGVVINSNN